MARITGNNSSSITDVSQACNSCGACKEECQLLEELMDRYPADIARHLRDGITDDTDLDFFMRCSLCGLCRSVCPMDLDLPQMVREARRILIEKGDIFPESYRFLWVDHDYNFFSVFRDHYQTGKAYKKCFKEKCEVLFFPGCMLINESPVLVQKCIEFR